MRVESSGAARAPRRPTSPALSALGRLKLAPSAPFALAAGALVVTGRADVWVVALLLGAADRSAVPTLVASGAAVLALDRFGSAGLADVAGAQSVLGPAGWNGAGIPIAASWVLAVALVLACRLPAAAAVAGATGALLVAGPALNGGAVDAVVRIVALAAGAGSAWLLVPRGRGPSRQPQVALLLAGIALTGLFGISV